MKQSQESFTATLVALLAAFAWLAATAWLRPLSVPDEGRYVGVAWEMLRSGHWLTPTLDGLPYFHKPPLFYWITAASLKVFGASEFAGRAAPLVGAAIGASALYLFARSWLGPRGARLCLLALVTQPLFFVGAQFANLDMLVAGCIAACVLAFAHAALVPAGGSRRRALAGAYVFAALGVLAKGLIGAVLPALVIFVWLLVQRRLRALGTLLWLPGIALFIALTLPWFAAMQQRFPDFAHYFFVVQHFQRFAQGGFNNAQPLWFFPAVLLLSTVPWIPWAAVAARQGYWREARLGPLRQLMWLWLVLVTLFFSMPQSKLVGYILPVTVPLAYLAGDAALLLVESPRFKRLWRASAIVAVAVCVAVAVLGFALTDRTQLQVGELLRARVQPQDQVVFLEDYYFAVPFYARLDAPVRVVADWSPAEVARHDNWRKELADAHQFDVRSDSLVSPAMIASQLCRAPATWLVGHRDSSARYPWLGAAEQISIKGQLVVWRITAQQARALTPPPCRETPSANSADKS